MLRSTINRLNPETEGDVPAYMQGTANSKMRHGGTLERKKNMPSASSMVNLAKENPGVSKGFTSVTTKLGNG